MSCLQQLVRALRIAIRDELAKCEARDQEVRTNKHKLKDMAKVDADNMAYMTDLVKEVSWVEVDRFGVETSRRRSTSFGTSSRCRS